MTEAWMIPNIPGLGGSPFFSTGGGGLSNAQAQYNQNQGYFGDQSRTMAAAQVPQSQLYGGGSFGAQPAHYAGVGAAYGRATGGFGGLGAPNADPFTPVSTGGGGGGGFPSGRVTRGPDLPDLSPSMPAASPIPYLSGGGMPFGGGGFSGRGASPFFGGAPAVPNLSGGGAPFGDGGFGSEAPSPPAQASFGDRFAGAGGGFNAFDPGIYAPSSGMGVPGRGGRGGAAAQPPALTGAPADMSDPDTPSMGGSSVHMRGMNPATPVPYQYAGGQAFPGAGIGSSQPTNMRDRIANIMSGSQGNQMPIMGAGGDDNLAGGGGGFTAVNGGPQETGGGFRGGVTSGFGSVGAPEGGFNSYGLGGGGGGIGSFGGGRGRLTTGIGTTGGSVSGEGSPFTSNSFTQASGAPAWQSSIPPGRGLPEVTKAVYDTAAKHGYDPAALAGVIGMESKWDPRNTTGSYFGMTQMGKPSFDEAGGALGGLTWDQYRGAPAAKQIGAYGDWLGHYAGNNSNNAASLVTGGIGRLPSSMQAAIMQGTQFAPNAIGWPAALGQGNTSMRTTPSPQAGALGDTSIGAMNKYFDRTMRGWPTNQKWGPY